MLRLLYYRYKKSGKISTKKGGGVIIRHGRIIRILWYTNLGLLLGQQRIFRNASTVLKSVEQ